MKKIYLIAFIVAVITGFAVYNYAGYLQQKSKVRTFPVVVASQRIESNTLLTGDLVHIKQLPAEAINKLAARSMEDLKDKVTKGVIEADEQIIVTKLGEQGKTESGLSYVVKEGYRAMTIKVDEITGVAGYISKGDKVDIIATMVSEVAGQGKIPASTLIIENVEILQTGTKAVGKTDSAGAYSSVTVSVLAEDVLKVNYALTEGKYRLVLRNVLDIKNNNSAPYAP